jgi:hypothetical protein
MPVKITKSNGKEVKTPSSDAMKATSSGVLKKYSVNPNEKIKPYTESSRADLLSRTARTDRNITGDQLKTKRYPSIKAGSSAPCYRRRSFP